MGPGSRFGEQDAGVRGATPSPGPVGSGRWLDPASCDVQGLVTARIQARLNRSQVLFRRLPTRALVHRAPGPALSHPTVGTSGEESVELPSRPSWTGSDAAIWSPEVELPAHPGASRVSTKAADVKPHLRGWLHAGVTPVVLAAGLILIWLAPTAASRWAAAVYSLAGVMLFATSAVYNLGTWGARGHAVLQRFDHSNIYLIIAGTYTPVAILALDGWKEHLVIVGAWIAAAVGVIFRVLWIHAPRLLYTGLCIALGWAIVPFIGDLYVTSPTVGTLTLVGGLLYTLGGVVYALKRPDPNPTWFGFHEIFHALTIVAWACQYVAISLLTYQA